MSTPHKCPVCDGEGKRPNPELTTGTADKPCHACGGSGVLWSDTFTVPYPQPVIITHKLRPNPQYWPWFEISPNPYEITWGGGDTTCTDDHWTGTMNKAVLDRFPVKVNVGRELERQEIRQWNEEHGD